MSNTRQARQGFLGPEAEKRLSAARVVIAGLCGGGSHVAQQLAHIGVGHFELIDFDRADTTNANRMVGLSAVDAEAESFKVDVIEALVKAVNPAATVRKHACRWDEVQDVMKNCSAIFGCVDRFDQRDALERFARRYLVPYIDVGMDVHSAADGYLLSGQVFLSLPNQPCLRCFGLITEERLAQEAADYGAAGGRPQVIWPNGVLASTAVGKFMQLVVPWSKTCEPVLYTEYDGNRDLLQPSHLIKVVHRPCPHFDSQSIGDEQW